MRLTQSINDRCRRLDDQLLQSALLPVEEWTGDALAAQLSSVQRRHGTQFATAWLYQTLNQHPAYRDFIQQFSSARPETLPSSIPLSICVVPGAFYKEYPRVDSSGHALRSQLRAHGIDTELIPVQSTGTLNENAMIIRQFLRQRRHQPLALISLSKGGADIKVALQQSLEDFQHVQLWYSISGTLSGAELVNWVQQRWWARAIGMLATKLTGRDPRFFTDMSSDAHAPLQKPLVAPDNMTIVHVAGFTLARHTRTRMAHAWYRRLEKLGPTDSMILLRDLLQLPGYLLPVWGVDHYWKNSEAVRRLACGIIGHAHRLTESKVHRSEAHATASMNRLPLEHSR